MMARTGRGDGLEPDLPDDLTVVAGRLHRSRPAPTRAFVERLRVSMNAGALRLEAPTHLRAKVAGFAIAGVALLLIGAAITFL